MADELRTETLEVPDRVRRQIEELQQEENLMPGEGERWTIVPTGTGYTDVEGWDSSRNDSVEVVPASRLEAAESALRSLVEAVEYEQIPVALSDELKAAVEQARSQIEGSKL